MKSGEIWIGATDAVKEGTWIWESSKTSMTYSYWNRGEPNNGYGGENCLVSLNGGWWNDDSCERTWLSSMCEVVFPC